jgi:hypothetical protein
MKCQHDGRHLPLWRHTVGATSPRYWQVIETALNHADEDEVGDQISTVRELLGRGRPEQN